MGNASVTCSESIVAAAAASSGPQRQSRLPPTVTSSRTTTSSAIIGTASSNTSAIENASIADLNGRAKDELTTRITWECVTRLDYVQWSDATITISFVVLGLINVMVIVGNTLVIMAVFLTEKLRTVTNLFIVSLAVSDLLVGLAVLPFSTANEVLGVWIFGAIWCEVWLAVDVWMCTASILNLCAISLDRYVAVTRPVSYPNIMSPRRAKILIALVWSVSFVICFPPLVGWNDSRQHGGTYLSSTLYAPLKSTVFISDNADDLNGDGNNDDGDDVDSSTTTLRRTFTGTVDSLDSEDYAPDVDHMANRTTSTASESLDFIAQDQFNSSWAVARNDVLVDRVHQRIQISQYEKQRRWHDDHKETEDGAGGGRGHTTNNVSVLCQCQLISDKGYRIYSAIGSFYLPMFVMLFFYWRIYKAAVETTRAINQGFRTTSSKSTSAGGRFEEQRLTLRIHRGRSSNDLFAKSNGELSSAGANAATKVAGRKIRNSSVRESATNSSGSSSRLSRGASGMTFPPSGERKAARSGFHRGNRHHRSAGADAGTDAAAAAAAADSGSSTAVDHVQSADKSKAPRLLNNTSRRKAFRRHCKEPNSVQCRPMTATTVCCATTPTITSTGCRSISSNSLIESNVDELYDRRAAAAAAAASTSGGAGKATLGKRNIKNQVKRFRMETKAAKTLAIIVGAFIVCWCPFFSIYLLGAFCMDSDCIPESLFAVAFWLGYCNSAINPCVYALFSRDFRNAFKRILCRCFMRRDHNVKKRIVTMFPATFHLASFFEESEEAGNSNSR